jgi:hypothetical protein
VRADLHNTSGHFERVFQPDDFMPGRTIESVEERAKKLIAEGVPPARAVAMAHSTQDRTERATIIETTLESSRLRAMKGGKKRMKPAG